MKALLGWLGRTGLLYLILCGAIAFYILAWPSIAPDFSGERLREDAMSAGAMRDALMEDRARLQAQLETRAADFRKAGGAALDTRLRAARAERAALRADLAEGGGLFDRLRPSRILARKRDELALAGLDAEIAALEQARAERSARTLLDTARAAVPARIPTQGAVAAARRTCALRGEALAAFEARLDIDRGIRNLVRDERQQLTTARDAACREATRRAILRSGGLAARDAYLAAQARYAAAREWAVATLPEPARDPDRATLRDVAVRAALALLAILLAPLAIRTGFYYVLAPIAERRRSIRIAVPGQDDAPPVAIPAQGSRASLQVVLGANEEALVRQGFLQSSAGAARNRTRWLLSWRKPLVSLASGMAFLTRIRGAGTVTGISDEGDPFAELTLIALPPGAAVVLRPRALAAVIQPQDRPMRVTSHWRLFNANAWLTLQLRFLAFHGPCRLAIRGGRGVRVEPVEGGRVFGQDQMAGFSASVTYSVNRNETFAPYLFGRAPLFRDRVEGGQGIVIIEESPMAGRRRGLAGGLEGVFDAGLKAIGI